MSQSSAFIPGNYASGVRVVSTTLRPARPACLIPDDDPGLAAKFVESRCLAWSGYASYVIPYSRSGGLSEGWEELLGLLDPDELFALGPFRAAEKERLNAAGWFVYPRDEPTGLFIGASTLLHSVLEAMGQDLKPPDSERFVVIPKVPRGAPSYLPLLARFGGMNEEELKHVLEERHSRYRFHLDLSELVRIQEVDLSRSSLLEIFAGDLRGPLGEEEAERALTLPDLTLEGLQIEPGPRSGAMSRTRRRSTREEYYSPVLVTGTDGSVEDFALYWNLRAEHYLARPFPLWMPLAVLEDAGAAAAIEGALGRIQTGVGVSPAGSNRLRIVSASTPEEELEQHLRHSYPEARIGVESFAELFATKCGYSRTTEKSPAYFERGRASIRPPRPEEFKNLVPGVDCVAYEVGIDGIWLPQSKAVAWHIGSEPYESRELFTKEGTLRFVKQFNKEFSETDLLDLRTPDGWNLLSSVFEERGYDVLPTDKSEAALGQLALLGGIENLKVIASSKVRRLLNELCIRRGEKKKRKYVAARKTVPLERFAEEWGDVATDVLRWLIERRVLFRGAELTCPKCQLSWWYNVDRIGEIWRCDGCQQDLPIPLELHKTGWQYRVNELYAYGHDQGTLTPLLTLYAMQVAWGTRPSSGGFGFYPGIKLKAKEGADVPIPEKEIDLVAMRGSSLILAECKESTEHLASPEKASRFARQLGDLVELADHLEASRLLITSSTTFPDKGPLRQEVPAYHSVELQWLDGHDLLDPTFFMHPLVYGVPEGGTRKPEGWETRYLEWVRRGIIDPSA